MRLQSCFISHWIALHSLVQPNVLAISLKQCVQFLVIREITNIDSVIDLNIVLNHIEVSSPAKNRVLSDFGDEALDSSGLFSGVCQTFTVAQHAAGNISQRHVNCMPHEVIAVFRGFDWSTAK